MTLGKIVAGVLIACLLFEFAAPMTSAALNPSAWDSPAAGSSVHPSSVGTSESRSPWAASGETGAAPSSDLTFAETGLPANTTWEVSLSRNASLFATDDVTNRTALTEDLSDGRYNVAAAANLSGYEAYAAPDSVDLSGAPVTVSLHFYPGYDLTFSIEGLPYNETWNISVSADGFTQNRSVAGNSTVFWIPAGNFSYLDSAVGYTPALGAGLGRLLGNDSIPLDFTRARPILGTLRITTDVPSADVYLNGQINPGVPQGTTLFNLTPGVWSVFVHAAGYGDYFNVTTIRSNQNVTMVVNLQSNQPNPGPALLSGTAELIIVCLVAGIAVIGVLFVVAWTRFARG